jgi:hypothetical protein
MDVLLFDSSRDIFTKIISAAPQFGEQLFGALSACFDRQSKTWKHTTDNKAPGREIQAIFDGATVDICLDTKQALARFFCAKMALTMLDRIDAENLPDSILAYYPAEFDRLAERLQAFSHGQGEQGGNLLERVTRFLLCLTVPCGAQDLDLTERVPITSALMAIQRERSVRSLLHYVRCRGTGIWLRPHTNTGRLEEFNEAGWDKFYLRVAEVLARRQHVRGLALTSWFYDPALLEISPRLAYLQTRPQERGAHLMKHGSSDHAIEFATRTSETRRHLYEKGQYLPTEYSILWGRRELLTWAAQQSGQTALQ